MILEFKVSRFAYEMCEKKLSSLKTYGLGVSLCQSSDNGAR